MSHDPDAAYEARLRARLPVYSTRLVRECSVSFSARHRVKTPEDAAFVLRRYFEDKDREELVALLLDTALTVIGIARVSTGGLAGTVVEPAQVFKPAILANAAAVIVAHNHPSGNPEPSAEDVRATHRLASAGSVLGIPVNDHLIVTATTHTSFAERGLMPARTAQLVVDL